MPFKAIYRRFKAILFYLILLVIVKDEVRNIVLNTPRRSYCGKLKDRTLDSGKPIINLSSLINAWFRIN